MSRVLVTGGAGFIGSHVCEVLCEMGYEVTALDNLFLGKWRNLDEVPCDRVYASAREILHLRKKYDVIVHLGQPSSSPMYRRDPELVADVIKDMITVLKAAEKWGARVILGSSSSVYIGNPVPWREDMSIKPRDWYTEAKYMCERLCYLWALRRGVECVALRLFSVFGEREEHKCGYANVITQMIWAALRGDTFHIYGDGMQTRDLIYVKDVALAVAKAIEYDFDGKIPHYQVFNVGRGIAYSFLTMAELLRKNGLKVRLSLGHKEPPFYIRHTLADTTKMIHELGFTPQYRVEEVLPKVIDYYRNIFCREDE
ncbi:MAG: nucleoside-diphosphate sugar epimerase [Thermoprotei archaeon]|nr:MAG: nucleoside-diphosphate sugar epimerase [Thermoprotei archaeon]